MDRINENLFIGDSEDYRNPELSQIDTIINLSTVNLEVKEQLETPVIDIPLKDGRNELLNFFLAVDTVKNEIERESTTVMVTCREGVSRSPAITATALASIKETSFEQELESIKEERPKVHPLPQVVEQCKYYLGEETKFELD